MPASSITELDAKTLEKDQPPPVIVDRERLETNELRMASCLTRYDVRKNCVHIHD